MSTENIESHKCPHLELHNAGPHSAFSGTCPFPVLPEICSYLTHLRAGPSSIFPEICPNQHFPLASPYAAFLHNVSPVS